MKNKSNTTGAFTFQVMLVLLAIHLGSGTEAFALSATATCRGWFANKFEKLVLDVKSEKKALDQIAFDERSVKEVVTSFAGVIETGNALCDRLGTIPNLKVQSAETQMQSCMLTFSNWEDRMDMKFTEIIMEKDLLSSIDQLAKGQETHRREARLAILLCKSL